MNYSEWFNFNHFIKDYGFTNVRFFQPQDSSLIELLKNHKLHFSLNTKDVWTIFHTSNTFWNWFRSVRTVHRGPDTRTRMSRLPGKTWTLYKSNVFQTWWLILFTKPPNRNKKTYLVAAALDHYSCWNVLLTCVLVTLPVIIANDKRRR